MALSRYRLAAAVLGGLTIVACNDASSDGETGAAGLPEWEGQRVVVKTEIVDEVCVGTLTWLDALVESIEAELELDASEKKIEVYLLDSEEVEDLCGEGAAGCASSGRVYVSRSDLSRATRHELAHARLFEDGILGTKFFLEGIASALSPFGGCLASDVCAASELEALLAAAKSTDLVEFDGYTAGSDLVHGMLNTYGPAAVLAFIAELPGDAPPDEVRAAYVQHFGATIDSDFEAFKRDVFDDYTLAQLDCDGLVAAPRGADGSVEIHSSMECSSPEVVNQFSNSTRGTVTWTFTVTPEQSGAFQVIWGASEAFVTLLGCRPPSFDSSDFADLGPHYVWSWKPSFDNDVVVLAPGQYSIEWPGDFGASLDFELVPPCSFETGGCPAGEQCTIWNECRPEVAAPASIDEPCEQAEDAPLTCEAGARCMGGTCVAECDATQECGAGQGCSRTRVCGAICDLLAQDCASGFACLPSAEDELNESGLGVCLAAGVGELFASCERRESECQSGSSCELVTTHGSSPCDGEDGCCVPYCDASAVESGCPSELPVCDPIRGGSVGVCHPLMPSPGG